MQLHEYIQSFTYPGRGVVFGRTADDRCAVAIYFIMGRSENSRNRIFEKTSDGIRTAAFDAAKLTDPSLIIYHPVRGYRDALVVTNGVQTDTISDCLQLGAPMWFALHAHTYEPDAPNFTPRISGLQTVSGGAHAYELSILRMEETGNRCERAFFTYADVSPGKGHIIHTYAGDGDPLPSFRGKPVAVMLPGGDVEQCAAAVWENLNTDNRVALYARFTQIQNGRYEEYIINRYCE